jgi:ABC-type antimicrobial peptide transport system permease subunit
MMGLVMKQGFWLAAICVILGLAAALGLTRLMASLLFGVQPTDAVTFVSVSALLTVVALVASYIPARRATQVDPMKALRYE